MKKHGIVSHILIGLIISVLISGIVTYMQVQNEQNKLSALMDSQATLMDTSVEKALTEVYALQALVMGADGGDIDLERYGENIVRSEYRDYVRNVLIAPDGVVSQVYPLDGNENVLGLDLYSTRNATYKEALEARDSDEIVLTGPYNMVQGGQAISGRLRVVLEEDDGSSDVWGLVSVSFAFPEVMQHTATDVLTKQGYLYRVLKFDEKSGEYGEILNEGYVDGKTHEEVDFSIDSMKFRLEAYPAKGWVNYVTTAFMFVLFFAISFAASFNMRRLAEQRSALKERVSMDGLTGVMNRTAGEHEINKIIGSKAFHSGIFILLDIDSFKSVNDVLGHQMGDEVLRESAQIYRSIFRSTDVVCRLGGDEFVIFLPNTLTKHFLQSKIDAVLHAMDRTIVKEDQGVKISCSIGIAYAPEHGMGFDELYEHADKALYKSKQNGRNQATEYSESPAE